MRLAASLLLFSAACGRYQFASLDGSAGDDGIADDDATVELSKFNTPIVITALSHPLTDDDPTITGDGLELYFASERGGAATGYADIYVSSRATTFSAWSAPTPVAELNSVDEDQSPGITADGLTIYFSSRRATASIPGGSANTWVATRPDRTSAWSAPQLVLEVSSTMDEFEPQPDASNTSLVFYRQINSTDRDIFLSTRANTSATWSTPAPIAEINTIGIERSPFLSADGLTIWFSSDRPSTTGSGINDIYVAKRTTTSVAFDAPVPEDELNSADDDDDPSLTSDARIIVFTRSTPPNSYEIYEARR
jgi:Tol biopolymer transport system component